MRIHPGDFANSTELFRALIATSISYNHQRPRQALG
jgi:hypothetical protein